MSPVFLFNVPLGSEEFCISESESILLFEFGILEFKHVLFLLDNDITADWNRDQVTNSDEADVDDRKSAY